MAGLLSREAKLSMYLVVCVPFLIYDHEVWVMTEINTGTVEISWLGTVAGVMQLDKCRSTVIRREFQVEPLLL